MPAKFFMPLELGFGTLALVDGIPPVAGRPGRRHRRPEALLGDKGYDSDTHRDELRNRRILPVISRKRSPNIRGIGKLRYVVEQTFALLYHCNRLAVRWERRTELHDDAFVSRLTGPVRSWRPRIAPPPGVSGAAPGSVPAGRQDSAPRK